MTALLFFSDLKIVFKSFKEKLGLAASCINTLVGLNFLIYFIPINDDLYRSFPPFIISAFFGKILLIFFLLLTTRIIFLKSFDFNALSIECSKRGLFL